MRSDSTGRAGRGGGQEGGGKGEGGGTLVMWESIRPSMSFEANARVTRSIKTLRSAREGWYKGGVV
jgi:hypothetical protein